MINIKKRNNLKKKKSKYYIFIKNFIQNQIVF